MINAIAVWNTRYFEKAQRALARQGVSVPEHVWQRLFTSQWAHIHLNGSYHFTDITHKGDFRHCMSIKDYACNGQFSLPERADAGTTPTLEQEELLNSIQLSLFLEEENDL